MRNLISRLYRRETSEEEWRWRRFPPRRSLPPLPPSLPLFHDLTISLLGIKFDLGDPPFASSPDLAIFSCPTERSRCVIFVMAVIIGGRLGPSAGLTGSGCFRSSSMSPCSHTAHLSHLQMFGSSVFHLVPAVAGLSMCMCLATSIFLSWFHRLWPFSSFLSHICKIRARSSYKFSHNTPFLAPPLTPQGCILYDHFPPLHPRCIIIHERHFMFIHSTTVPITRWRNSRGIYLCIAHI
jgi:hypothetical protein